MNTDQPPKLKPRYKVFADAYLKHWNGTKAAKIAGYSAHTADRQASRLLGKADIAAYIEFRTNELQMGADEVLIRLAEIARGDMTEFLDEDGKLDLAKARKSGRTALVSKVKQKKRTFGETEEEELEIELYSRHDALRDLGKRWALFTDKVSHEVADLDQLLDLVHSRQGKEEE